MLDNLSATRPDVAGLVRLYFQRNRPSRFRKKAELAESVRLCAACFDEALTEFSVDELRQAIEEAEGRCWWWQIVEKLRERRRLEAEPVPLGVIPMRSQLSAS